MLTCYNKWFEKLYFLEYNDDTKDAKPGEKFQFVRTGFFTPDSKNPGVYNRVVTLRDSFKPAK